MIIKYSDFIDFNYKPSSKDLICLFRINPGSGFSIKESAARVASESSNGTWTGLDVPSHIPKISAKCFKISRDYAWIAYPEELFELGSIPQVVSSIMGNIFGMKAVDGLRLEDVTWPKSIVNSFRGPKYGIKGVRKLLNIKDRPLLATVPKPKVGYYPDEHAKVGYNAWAGGVDLLKDDENLTNQSFNPFEKRLDKSMAMMHKAEKETGEKKGYLINVTAETNEMIRRARLAKKAGNDFVMIDILTAGWSGLQTLREETEKLGLAIHAHRAFHSTFDRNPRHGITMRVIIEMARLIGVDSIHIGGLGKLVGGKTEVSDNYIKASMNSNDAIESVLAQDWHDINPCISCCSGGLHPGIIERLTDLLGSDLILQAGGGIHGHPGGTHSGAIAFRQAFDAIKEGISVKTYAKTHEELGQAINKWGSVTPK
ncbi:MAG TPA: type III ribulose-bisphosphate carboxylase [Candidatus Nanoarchaeia archaeon]|nr:RuBisCO long chain, Form III-b [uncultured archaeon]HLE05749.1 type III ribulose-bisphosphate carboxylase [Candidatus Nanoarchaeia archaeon]